MNIFSTISNFNIAGIGDWGLLLIFLAVAFIYGLAVGKARILVIILGSYFSYILITFFPWKDLPLLRLTEVPPSTVQIFIFLTLIVGFYFLIPSSAFRGMLKSQGRRKSNWWQCWILSILQIGLILEMIITFLTPKVLYSLNPVAKMLLVGSLPKFLWLLLPILAAMFLKERHYDVGQE